MPHSSGGGSHGGGSHGGSHGRGSSGHRTSHSYFPGSTRYAYYHKGRIEYYYRDAEYTAEEEAARQAAAAASRKSKKKKSSGSQGCVGTGSDVFN